MNLPKRVYYIGIEDRYSNEVYQWWNYYDKPCDLLFVKAKTEGLTAIKVVVTNNETASFILKLKERIRCQIVEINNK